MRGPRTHHGWSSAEYLAVVAGLMVLWRGVREVLRLLVEYHDEFSWTLMLPF